MRALRAIAGITFHETGRQPTTWIITAVAAVMLLTLPYFLLFGLGMEDVLMKEMGLSTITLATILVALLGAANTITRELEGRTILMLLAKPVSRAQVVVGKYLGLMATITVVTLVLLVALGVSTIVFHATYGPRGSSVWSSAAVEWRDAQLADADGGDDADVDGTGATDGKRISPYRMPGTFNRVMFSSWRVAQAEAPGILLGTWLGFWGVSIIAAVLVAGSTFLPIAANAVLALVVFLLGNLMDLIDLALADVPVVQTVVRVLIPNLRLFEIAEAFARDLPLPMDLALWGAAVGLAYITAILTVGCLVLQRRDVG